MITETPNENLDVWKKPKTESVSVKLKIQFVWLAYCGLSAVRPITSRGNKSLNIAYVFID